MTDRTSDHPIDRLFLDRWSPRAFDGTPVAQADLDTMLEAARWAPSAYNIQPWRLLYAVKGDAHWDAFLALLIPFNQSWAKEAGALVFVLSDTLMGQGEELKPSHSHSLDAGSAWMQLALQATLLGYAAHGMSGVDFGAAQSALNVPERFRVEMAIAIGRPADASILPDGLREREGPSDRKPLAEIAWAGPFKG